MKSWFKYGLLSVTGYVVVIAILTAVFHWINSVAGNQDINRDNHSLYVWAAATGLMVAFIAGFCFCPILERMTLGYAAEHPDILSEDIRRLCREKLLTRYFCVFACGSFLAVIAMAVAVGLDSYPDLICTLSGAGFTFAFLYFQNHNRYKHLYRHSLRTASRARFR